jgi:hypothetical protein
VTFQEAARFAGDVVVAIAIRDSREGATSISLVAPPPENGDPMTPHKMARNDTAATAAQHIKMYFRDATNPPRAK